MLDLQIYEEEKFYDKVSKNIYLYLKINKENFTNYNSKSNLVILLAIDFIKMVNDDGF